LASVAVLCLVLLVPLVAGCATDRQSTLLRSSRARAVGALRAEREQQERELELWQATRDQAKNDIAVLRFDSVRTSSELRSVRGELRRELEGLAAGGNELLLAQQRAIEIEQELEPLRALEHQLIEQQQLMDAARDRLQSLTTEVAKATAEAAQQEAVLKPKLVALQKRLTELQAAGVQIAETEAKIEAAQKVLAPAAPAVVPAKQ